MLLQYFGTSVSVDLYGTWSYPFTVALIVVLGICMFESLGKHWIKGIILGAVLIPVFVLARPFPNTLENISASLLAFAGISSAYQVIKSSGAASFREIKGEFITETPIFISVANVRVIPGMTILWSGSILVVIGIVPLLLWRKKP